MERIQAAIQKAKEQRTDPGAVPARAAVAASAGNLNGLRGRSAAPAPAWAELDRFEPDPQLLARNRVVTFADADPAHATYDMMRTKLLRALRQNGWTSVAITSPTNGCGKTTTSLNLAFSLSHQPDVKTVLVDLDLRRPAVAKEIGLAKPQSMASVLQGTRPVAENFVRYGETLAIGTNAMPVYGSSELLLNAATAGGVAALKAAFQPDVILYDMPPMLMSDDVMAFLPHVDCVLLIAAAEKSRLDEVDKCEQELAEQTNVLGVVLNKCRYTGADYGYY
ncbi:MAG TPA: CpsD/CapB family tyrosine-protein kinase [Amaricoccus sp.]|nr:CpsD/CapB family tyrosine-protein kinase [Amaricoccus sp.]